MKKTTQIWMVRAGEQGYLYDEFLSKKVVVIGWNGVRLKSTKITVRLLRRTGWDHGLIVAIHSKPARV